MSSSRPSRSSRFPRPGHAGGFLETGEAFGDDQELQEVSSTSSSLWNISERSTNSRWRFSLHIGLGKDVDL